MSTNPLHSTDLLLNFTLKRFSWKMGKTLERNGKRCRSLEVNAYHLCIWLKSTNTQVVTRWFDDAWALHTHKIISKTTCHPRKYGAQGKQRPASMWSRLSLRWGYYYYYYYYTHTHTYTHTRTHYKIKQLIIHSCINIYLNDVHKLKRNDQTLLDLRHAPIALHITKLLSN